VSLRDVLAAAAACRGRVSVTPLEGVAGLRDRTGRDVRLKLEAFQRTGSFKLRGALAGLHRLGRDGGPVVTASAGNHGLGLAEAAVELGAAVRIYVPSTADAGKLDRLRAYGEPVEVVAVDGGYDATERAARADCAATGARFLSSYNDPGVVAGQGTVALELLEQWPDLEAVVVPVGGGGLIGGVGLVLGQLAPAVRVVGVEPAGSCAMSRALAAGAIAPFEDRGSIAEGLVGNLDAGSITLGLAQRHVDEIVLVEEAEIRDAVRRLYDVAGVMAEPSGAVAIAALATAPSLRDVDRVVCLVTGRNVTPAAHRRLITAGG
jgi:threonine dehydratase